MAEWVQADELQIMNRRDFVKKGAESFALYHLFRLASGTLAWAKQGLAVPEYFTEKANSTPSICESCFPSIVKWGGKTFCAPAAVSNSLVWLANNGFPSLQPFHDDNPQVAQARLVNMLGDVMGTSEHSGTSPFSVFSGLKQFLDDRHVKYKRMAAVGWRNVPDFVAVDDSSVKLGWLKEGVLGNSSEWILIGWYKYDSQTDSYRIYDGHWMTVVGFGKNRAGRNDPEVLIVHDPAERAERKNYYPRIIPLQHGTLTDNDPQAHDKARPAKSALSISGDVVLKPGADFGILQGAYRLEL